MKTFKEYLSEASSFSKGYKKGEKTGIKAVKTTGKAIGTVAKTAGGLAKSGIGAIVGLHKAAQKSQVGQPDSKFQRHSKHLQKVQQHQQQRHLTSLQKKKNKNVTL